MPRVQRGPYPAQDEDLHDDEREEEEGVLPIGEGHLDATAGDLPIGRQMPCNRQSARGDRRRIESSSRDRHPLFVDLPHDAFEVGLDDRQVGDGVARVQAPMRSCTGVRAFRT